MQLDQVEAFVAIVRRGGFTRAASSLHRSQPAVSRRLELLERELGAPVLERVRGGVKLTEAGRAFLPYAEGLLASIRDGIEAVRTLERADHGTITLAVVGTLASTALTERLQDFRRVYPRVRLLLRTALSHEVSALVRRGDATLGLRYAADPHPDVISRPVYEEPMVVVCSATHRLARVRTVRPAALVGEPWVAFPVRPGSAREPYSFVLEQRLAACGLGGAEIITIDSLTAQKRMVEAGFGLGLVPESSIEEEVRLGTLRVLKIAALRATIPVVLIQRRRAYLSGAAQRLTSVLSAWSTPGKGKRRGRSRRGIRG